MRLWDTETSTLSQMCTWLLLASKILCQQLSRVQMHEDRKGPQGISGGDFRHFPTLTLAWKTMSHAIASQVCWTTTVMDVAFAMQENYSLLPASRERFFSWTNLLQGSWSSCLSNKFCCTSRSLCQINLRQTGQDTIFLKSRRKSHWPWKW